MNAREMHYDFKQKLNKIDSQQYRNFKVPEIDWKLNEAQEIFVKVIAQPRLRKQLGFEINNRTINDIRTIVVNQTPTTGLVPTVFDTSSFITALPNDYWFLIKATVIAKKDDCDNIVLRTKKVQHDDEHELSTFDRSSFEWRISNIRFNKDGLRIFTDGTYEIKKVMLDYLIQPPRIHNAQDFIGGTYTTLDNVVLTGSQSCILPKMVHGEIVDLAVFITAGDLARPDYQLKQNKTNITT